MLSSFEILGLYQGWFHKSNNEKVWKNASKKICIKSEPSGAIPIKLEGGGLGESSLYDLVRPTKNKSYRD